MLQEKKQIMFAQAGDALCPVYSLKKYLQKLNPKCEKFFQKPRNFAAEDDTVWYENKPVGINTMGKMMKTISEEAKLSTIYTNHSIRATTATVLAQAGVESRNICAVTGHKNESSLKSYISAPTMGQRDTMSNILHHYGKEAENNEVVNVPQTPNNVIPAQVLQEENQIINVGLPSGNKATYTAGALFAGAIFNGPTTINIAMNTV